MEENANSWSGMKDDSLVYKENILLVKKVMYSLSIKE
jgi:hypothetical protein